MDKYRTFFKSVYYKAATLWNGLPVNIRNCEDLDSFKLEIGKLEL